MIKVPPLGLYEIGHATFVFHTLIYKHLYIFKKITYYFKYIIKSKWKNSVVIQHMCWIQIRVSTISQLLHYVGLYRRRQ